MSGRAEAREQQAAERGYRVYGYRWVVLGVFMLVNVTIQVLWISYAPITSRRVGLLRRLRARPSAARDGRS